jgi:mannose-6-phosphate isomerase-like protein (cupin superfamily)
MNIRRVVTGHDHSGRSVFASDDEVDGLTLDILPGWEFFDMWGADATPTVPDAGEKPTAPAYFPAAEGFRFSFSVIPPKDTPPQAGVDPEEALATVNAALPGMMDHLEPDGFHTTDTVDMEIILKGEVTLVLDDGQEKLLRPGDTVVQNGTRHVWRVDGPEPCLMAVFMIGAHRAGQGA